MRGDQALKELSIVVVDDSVVIRDLLICAFTKVEGCSLIGMAADGEEGITMIRALQPNVVILDISMPQKNGIEVLKEIRQENDEVLIIMFTSYSSAIFSDVCLEAGADYYLEKTQLRDLIDICKVQIEGFARNRSSQFLLMDSDWRTPFRSY
jgi:DNA-binding NarL/FixJ family response regulator